MVKGGEKLSHEGHEGVEGHEGMAAVCAADLKSFEDVLELVGTKGNFNLLVIFACASVGFMTPMQVLSADFLGRVPDHWCLVQDLRDANWTTTQIRAFASPNNASCSVLDYDYSAAAALGYEAASSDPSLVPGGGGYKDCSRREFTPGVESIVTEWDLVCDRLAWYSTTIAAAQGGLFLGSLLFGYLLDRLGRRRGLLLSTALFLPSGLAVAASLNVYMYALFRVAVCMFGMGMYLGGFVLSMELCTPAQRSLVSSYFVLPWALGYMATAVIAYSVQYWRHMQVAFTAPALLLYANYFIVPESPRWLVQRGRYQEALRELSKMAARNKRSLPSDGDMLQALRRITPPAEGSEQPVSLRSWYQTWLVPQFLWKTPVVFFCWFAVSMVYYGVSQGASNLGVNEYEFIFVGGALEIVSYLTIYPGVRFLGRRNCLVISYVVAAVSILGVMGMQLTGYSGSHGGLAFLSYTGKFMITASFHLVYILTGELFPTALRSLMIGEASVCARVGSILSPYINVLMGANHVWAPSAFFGSFSIVAGFLAALLPETNNQALDGVGGGGSGGGEARADPASKRAFNNSRFEME